MIPNLSPFLPPQCFRAQKVNSGQGVPDVLVMPDKYLHLLDPRMTCS